MAGKKERERERVYLGENVRVWSERGNMIEKGRV